MLQVTARIKNEGPRQYKYESQEPMWTETELKNWEFFFVCLKPLHSSKLVKNALVKLLLSWYQSVFQGKAF